MPASDDIAGIRAKLNDERSKLLSSFAHLDAALLLRPAGPGGWSIKDILAHVATSERVNVQFAQMMVAQDGAHQLQGLANEFPDFPGEFELDKFNAWTTERGRAQSWDEVISALYRVREKTLQWLDSLSPDQLERTGEHAVWGQQTVRATLRMLAIHDRMHRVDIEKAVRTVS